MALNFPDSPSNGDTATLSGNTYTFASASNSWTKQAVSGAALLSQDTAPANPASGNLWFNTVDAALYTYYEDSDTSQWVGISGPRGISGSSPNFSSIAEDLVPDGNETRDLGSASNKWKDLHLSGNTLNLGAQSISANAGGIVLPAVTIGTGTNKVVLSASATGGLTQTGTNSAGVAAPTSTGGGVGAPTPGAATAVADMPALVALTGMTTGQTALVTGASKVFMYTGSAWYKIADMVNEAPSAITGVAGTYVLAKDATATTITAVSADPEGYALAWSFAVTAGSLTVVSGDLAVGVVNNGSGAYTLSGGATGDNANVAVAVGQTVNFTVNASGHPFHIRDSNGGSAVSSPAATGQGSASGVVSWTPNTAGTYYYQCGIHNAMVGTITVSAAGVVATVSRADNVFTITPNDQSNSGEFSLTFSATDGINGAVNAVSAFTLTFIDWASPTTQATIYPAGSSGVNGFGSSGGISGDGKYAIVGAYLDGGGATQGGAAYAFERTGTSWNIASGWQRLLSPSPQTNAFFGGDRGDSSTRSNSSIAISGDGLTAVIGERGQNKAHIYTRSGSTWTFQATVEQTGGTANLFGYNVGISGDGNTVIVGDSYGSSQNGDMYIFGRSGSTWTLELKQTKTTHFGCSVDLSADGLIAVVGNMYMSGYTGTGGVHIYTKSGSTWTEGPTLTSTSPAETNKLGRNVRISGDGNVIIAGTVSPTPGSNSGSALVWTKSGSTYSLTQTFLPETSGDKFGEDVSVNNDGSTIAIGSPDYDTINSNAGRLYVYQLSGSTYALKASIDPPGSSPASNKFGKHAMSQDGTTILGFTIFDSYSNGKGYVFVP